MMAVFGAQRTGDPAGHCTLSSPDARGQGRAASSGRGQDCIIGYDGIDLVVGQVARDTFHRRMPARPVSKCHELIVQVDSALTCQIRCLDVASLAIGAVARSADGEDIGIVDCLCLGVVTRHNCGHYHRQCHRGRPTPSMDGASRLVAVILCFNSLRELDR
jgi:hypothetical protein